MKAGTVIALVGTYLILIATFSWWRPAARDGTVVAPYPNPDHHIEWKQYPVGGFVLVNPMIADSLGIHPTIILPDGTYLFVPHEVPGIGPDGS